MKTSYGFEFNTVTEIDPECRDYDKAVAECHLANAGMVIVDAEYGQPLDNKDDTVVCNKCGSSDIQTQAWVDPNTKTFIGATGIDRGDNWCNQCADNQLFTTLKKFKEHMQEWWEELEPSEMERITGLRQDRYHSQEFVDACTKWWNEKNYDEKRMILKKHNNDE